MSRLTTASKPAKRSVLLKAADGTDLRYHGARPLRTQMNKVFPTHWSFLLGEVAMYSFLVLLLSGVYLTLFFDASMGETVYQGVYDKLRGVPMSRAYASTLNISFDVRGGLLIRQIHHWAALLFLASMMLHMMRVFFTGAFRKPREANWIIGVLLLVLGMVEGFMGYSLPDDLLSGTGLRAVSAFLLSIPVMGTWIHWLAFGGDYPGDLIIGRFYALHILLVPGIILALIALHVGLVWFQKHTQFPGPRATEDNVIGVRIMPVFALKAGGFFAIVFGVIVLLSGLFQINPIWALGPYNPSQVSAGVQPDFYMGFLDGLVRVWPSWEVRNLFGHYMIPAVFFPAILGATAADDPGALVSLDRDCVHQGQSDTQPAAAPARRSGSHGAGRGVHLVLRAEPDQRRQRHHRVQVRHLAERDDLDRPDRHVRRPDADLHHHVPDLPRSAARGPGGARARRGDRHRQAAAAR